MKKLLKPFTILGSIILVIGIGLSIAAMQMGADITIAKHKIGTPNSLNTYFSGSDLSQITKIDIEINFASIIIKEGDTFDLEYTGFVHTDLLCEVNGSTLIIEDSDRFSFSDIFSSSDFPTIVLTIPYNYEFDTVSIKLDAGELTINALSTQKFEFDNGAGKATIKNLSANKSVFEGGIGEIYVSGTVLNLKYNGGVGKFTFDGYGTPSDYTYKISSGVGDVSINGENYGGLGNNIKIGDGKNTIDIKTGVGSVNINIVDV